MVNISKIVLLTICITLYHTEIVFSQYTEAVQMCIDDIYNGFGLNKTITWDIKENIGRHAMLYNREDLLLTRNSKVYFKYIEHQIYVDDKLQHPELYCDKIGEGFDPTMYQNMSTYYLNDIISERKRCKQSVLFFFPKNDDTLAVAKQVFRNLLVHFFNPMLDTNYAKMYYYILVNYTYFNDTILTPIHFCHFIHNNTSNDNTNNTSQQKKPDKESEDEPNTSKRNNNFLTLSLNGP